MVFTQQDIERLKKKFRGEICVGEDVLQHFSRDASLFEVKPSAILEPRDKKDIEAVVQFVSKEKKKDPTLSITVRAGGTCMSGGPLGESFILDVTKYLRGTTITGVRAEVLPGTYFRDFEAAAAEKSLMMPAYPASKGICAWGGMIGNNAGGEKTLKYGKVDRYVEELDVVLADGNAYTVTPMTEKELTAAIKRGGFFGKTCKALYTLLKKNEKIITAARPNVSKNSAGYALWNIWDGKTFDLTKLFVGSQGTLGIVTRAKVKLLPIPKHTKLLVVYLDDLTKAARVVNAILPHEPESLETFDDNTYKLAMRFFPSIAAKFKGMHLVKFLFSFLPDGFLLLRGGIPKLVLMAEFAGATEVEAEEKARRAEEGLEAFGLRMRLAKSGEDIEKYWTMRRESFNLLRKKVKGMRATPFIDDVIVRPEHMPEFLPRLIAILTKWKLFYTIAGHAGDGNFHIIPLIRTDDVAMFRNIPKIVKEVHMLVHEFEGSFTAEHNDGIIRTPLLVDQFGADIVRLFEEVKKIFDPKNIFNPGKKVYGTTGYMASHIAPRPETEEKHIGPWC